ncbi:hypothetical protein ACVGW6_04200, partial [Enterobacter intestinihominis]
LMGESSVLVLGGPRAPPQTPQTAGVSFPRVFLKHAQAVVLKKYNLKQKKKNKKKNSNLFFNFKKKKTKKNKKQ